MGNNMNDVQRVDLYKPIVANRVSPAPLVMRIGTIPSVANIQGGTMSNVVKVEQYVLLSALPAELQQRIQTAIDAILAAG